MSSASLIILLIALLSAWLIWTATGKRSAGAGWGSAGWGGAGRGGAGRGRKPEDALETLDAGTMITLTRFDGKDVHVNVSLHERHVYEEDGDLWYELECQGPDGPVSINVDPSDRDWVSITRRKISLEHLGIDAARIDEIERRDAGSVAYDGVHYEFEDWGEATYYPLGERSEGEDFKYWDFEDDAEGLITIERWEDGSYEVFISEWVRRNRVIVPSQEAQNEEQPA